MPLYLCDNDTLRWEHDGKLHLLHVHADPYPDNPRQEDNLGIMACFHRRYRLGDDLNESDPEDFWRGLVRQHVPAGDILAAARNGRLTGIRLTQNPKDNSLIDVYETYYLSTPFGDSDDDEALEYEALTEQQTVEYIRDDLTLHHCQTLMQPYAVWLPIWLYDHSGLTVSCGERFYPYSDPWDSGQLGWIIMLKSRFLSETAYSEDAWRDKAVEILRGEVQTYDQYLRGEVYWYEHMVAEPADEPHWDEIVDSCGGFYGADIVASGMADTVGDGLQEAIDAGAYSQGEAQQITRVYYKYV